MKSRTGKRTIAIALIGLAAISSLAEAKIKRSFEETIDLSGITNVRVKVYEGHITAFGENRQEADLSIKQIFKVSSESEATELEESVEKTIRKEGNTLYIEVESDYEPSWFRRAFGNSDPIDLDIKILLPREMNLSLDTAGGHVSAQDFTGDVSLETSGGHIEAEDIIGNLMADTSGGHVTVRDVDGQVNVKTSGGHITAKNITGDARLKTSGGHIKASMIEGHIDAKTSGGSIDASLPNGIERETTLRTSGGNVSVDLPKDARFTIDASTSAGRASSDFNVPVKHRIPGGKISGDVNGGGPILRLKTSGGNVSVNEI